MSLLTGYTGMAGYTGPDNKVLEEAPKDIEESYEYTDGYLQRKRVTTTTHTERYRYVGMTYAAALSCQEDLVTLYTESGKLVAMVSATPQAGRMWQVSVSLMRVTTVEEDVEV